MRPRSLARRLAFQYIFMFDLNRGDCETSAEFLEDQYVSEAAREYAEILIQSVLSHCRKVEAILEEHTEHYDLDRIAAVERSILKIAIAELQIGTTPFRVVIDEALNLSKKFGGENSSIFVNGILDAVARERTT